MNGKNQQMPSDLKKAMSLIAPGTLLREGLDFILSARMGGLIYFGNFKEIQPIMDGGFFLDVPFTPNHLYELGKMDGAIILSENCDRILYANAQLIPRYDIETIETGTRHKTAERVAKMTNGVIVCISHRRNQITLYHKMHHYILQDINLLINLASQGLHTVEKARYLFDEAYQRATLLETEGYDPVTERTLCHQRGEHLMDLYHLMENYLTELGNEGRLFELPTKELIKGIDLQMKRLKNKG